MKRGKNQKGFTLIELVIVLVILGIIGAVATSKYVDFRDQSCTASWQGVDGSLKATAAIMIGSNRGTKPTRQEVIDNTDKSGWTAVTGGTSVITITVANCTASGNNMGSLTSD